MSYMNLWRPFLCALAGYGCAVYLESTGMSRMTAFLWGWVIGMMLLSLLHLLIKYR